MDWLGQVAKHHTVYIGYVKGMGVTTQAEDIVQEMYLKLHKYASAEKCITNGKVNRHYVWRILYNLCSDYRREGKKFNVQSLDVIGDAVLNAGDYNDGRFQSIIEYQQHDCKKEEAFHEMINKILSKVDELDDPLKYPYNKELFNQYVYSDMSYRGLHVATKISTSSIFNTMKQCKEYLRDETREDLEDFNNEQYELI